MIKINLVPQEILDKEVSRQRAIQGAAGAAVVAVILASVSAHHYWRSVSLQKTLAADIVELDRLKKIVDQVTALEEIAKTVKARLEVVGGLMRYRALYPRFMEDLVKTLPPGVWLTSLSTTGDEKGLALVMACKGVSSEDAAAVLKIFEGSDRFKDPVLAGPITVGGVTSRESVFNLTVKYVPPAG
ncbi:MAG: PilN domain-containing protein [Elusimicrobia bacterium]|nr:PilN domain-containing protein [Elusimicrobiota bacterium]